MSNLARQSQNQAVETVKGSFTVLFQAALSLFAIIAVGWILSSFIAFLLAWAIGVLVGFAAWVFLDRVIWKKEPHYLETEHPDIEFEWVSGGRLLTEQELEQKSRRIKTAGSYLEAGAFLVSKDDQVKGFAYVGAPGTGKTLNIRLHMQATLPKIGKVRDHRALIYDAKGDMPQILSGLGFEVGTKNSVIKMLHPYDVRSVRWAMWKDIDDPKTINEIAPIFIPSENSKDPVWEQLARALLEGVLQTFIASGKPWTLRDVCCAMRSLDRLRQLFQLSNKTEALIQKLLDGGKTTKGIEMTIYAYMKPFEFIAAVWEHAEEEISLDEWLNGGESIILLGHDGAEGSALERLNQVIVKRLAQLVHQQPNSDSRRTWLYFDELRQAGFLELTPFATFGRSRGVCLVLGFQDMEGLEHKYDEKVARELLGMCQHKAFFALETDGTATWASNQFGRQEVLWRPTSRANGQESTNEQVKDQPVVKSEAFLYMDPFSKGSGHTGYYRSAGIGAYKCYLPPKVFERPSLEPLDQSIPCAAIKGQSLRGKVQQELDDWSTDELKKWGLIEDDAKEDGKEIVKEKQQNFEEQDDLPRLLKNAPLSRERIIAAVQAVERT